MENNLNIEEYHKKSNKIDDIYKCHRPDLGLKLLNELIDLALNNGDIDYSLYFEAQKAFYTRNLSSTIDLIEKAAKWQKDRNICDYFILRALSFYTFLAGNIDEAKKIIGNVLLSKPDDIISLCILTIIHKSSMEIEITHAILDKIMAIESNCSKDWYEVATIMYNCNRTNDMLLCFDRALSLNDNSVFYLHEKATILCRIDLNEAKRHFDMAIELDNDSGMSWYIKGKRLIGYDNFESIYKCFNEAISRDNSIPDAWYELGVMHFKAGQAELAEEHFKKNLKLDPNNNEAWLHLGIISIQKKEYKHAILCIDKALAIKEDLQGWLLKATVFDQIQKHENALVCFEKALEKNPNDIPTLYLTGLSANKCGKYETALKYLDIVQENCPEDLNCMAQRAIALFFTGNPEQGESYLRHIVDSEPYNCKNWTELASFLVLQGKFLEAVECYDQALQINPEDQTTITFMALSYYLVNDTVNATKYCNTANSMGDFFELCVLNGLLCLESNIKKSGKHFEKALKFNPHDGRIWYLCGACNTISGRIVKAKKYLETAAELLPNDFRVWRELAITCFFDMNIEQAAKYINIALNIKKDDYKTIFFAYLIECILFDYQTEDIISGIDSFIQIRPDDFRYWHIKADILEEDEQYEASQLCREEARKLYPDYDFWIKTVMQVSVSDKIINKSEKVVRTAKFFAINLMSGIQAVGKSIFFRFNN